MEQIVFELTLVISDELFETIEEANHANYPLNLQCVDKMLRHFTFGRILIHCSHCKQVLLHSDSAEEK